MATSQVSPPATPALEDIKALAFGLSALALALAGSLWISPVSINAMLFRSLQMVALPLPWVAVWMQARWPTLVNVTGTKTDPRPALTFLFVCPAACLAANQLQNLQINPWPTLLTFACIPALLLAGALFLASPRGPNALVRFVGLFAISGFYGYGVSFQADTLLDRSAPHVSSLQVNDKFSQHGTKGSIRYYLQLSQQDSSTDAITVRVKQPFYDKLQLHDTVCVVDHDGALQVPWRTVQACEPAP